MGLASYLGIAALTLKIAAVATLMMLPVGTSFGWLLARRRIPARPLVETVLLLPMILPPVAIGLALLALLAPTGPLGLVWLKATGQPLLLSWHAAALAAFTVALPLMTKSAEAAFAGVPRRLEDVALTLGLSRSQTFLRITLPLAARGLASGTLLAFARALGEFGATNLVAGAIPGETETLATAIYGRINAGDDREAWVLAGVSALLAAAALVASHALVLSRKER